MNPVAEVQAPDLDNSVEQYLSYLTNLRRCAENTARAYAHDLAGLLASCAQQGLTSPTQITTAVLETYLGSHSSLSANTIRRRAHAFGGWLEYCARQRWIPTNPARGLQLPRRTRHERRYPNESEVRALLNAARTPLERVCIWLLATAGLRRQELLDLDLASFSPDGTELLVRGKGDRERRLPLAEPTRQVLTEYLAARGSQAGPLLMTRLGTRIGVTHLRRLFARLLRRASLEGRGFTLHGMRHAFATLLLRNGTDIATVSRLLGHLSLEVTSIYVHSDPASCRAAVNALPLLQLGGDDNE
ncbi:MAG TPA: tyrosine-type recombinase/integrase [Armatimonadota bacterium]